MAAFNVQKVLSVHHWTDAYFSFTCTRDEHLRFDNGQFVMVGLMVDGKPLMRAYSVASANWEEHLEFFSIKVQNGPLTSRLQHLQVGDEVLISKKPTGTLICGGPGMLKDTCDVLNEFGLKISPKMGQRGDYVIERAFVAQ